MVKDGEVRLYRGICGPCLDYTALCAIAGWVKGG